MLFAISGSQGSGKSSVLAGLEAEGYTVMKRKISRSILADWGVSLDEVNSDPELSMKFQNEILVRKFEDEMDAVASSEIFFTERTYMDSFVYFMYTFGSKSKFNSVINDYYDKCVSNDSSYSGIFILPFGQFDIEHDGVRNSNHLYAESIDVVLRNFLEKSFSDKLHQIKQLSIEDRVKFVVNTIHDTAINT